MKRVVPKFETEAEEAQWWHEHLDEIEEEMADALEAGTAQVLTREKLLERIEARDKGTK